MMEHKHKHLESKECDLIKPSLEFFFKYLKSLPYVFFIVFI
jgi:hypothetical protein